MNRPSTDELINLIEQEIPKERVLRNLADRYSYSYDASFGEYLPDLVVQALTKEEVSFIIKLANEHRIPVYPRGSATSLSGGSLAVNGGIMLDMSQFEKS